MRYKIKVTQTKELEGWYEADTVELAMFEAEREIGGMGESVSLETRILAAEHSRKE